MIFRSTGAMVFVLLLYFLPFVIAMVRHHKAKLAIFLTDLLLGWTVVGWLAALIWACNSNTAAHPQRA